VAQAARLREAERRRAARTTDQNPLGGGFGMGNTVMANDLTLTNAPPAGVSLLGTLRALAVSLRPHQWVKNALVFGGLIFSQSLFQLDKVVLSVEAFALFCLASSGVYLLNDLRDVEEDRKHSVKRLRPLAAGTISPTLVTAVMAVLLIVPAAAGFAVSVRFGQVLACYALLNIAYTFALKRLVLLDVMCVAVCFVLRAAGGCMAIDVHPSPWLIVCTLLLALVVGFGKRRHELLLLQGDAGSHRRSLEEYSPPLLDLLMGISAAAAIVCFALYTMAEETVARFGSRKLLLTTPFVTYGIFRYLYLVHRRRQGGDPAVLFVTDVPTLVNAVLWVLTVCLILYVYPDWQVW
jgi:4-hydroxybenzoate polyprenyltransferase